jgi:hypothetical protein
MERTEILATTLGDLIVAITEVASRHARDSRETYSLVAYILSDLLNNFRPNPKGGSRKNIAALSVRKKGSL